MSDDGTLIFKRLGNLLRKERRPLRAGKETMSDILEDIPWWRTEIDRLRARVAELEAKNIIGKYEDLSDSRELEIWQKLWDRVERAEADALTERNAKLEAELAETEKARDEYLRMARLHGDDLMKMTERNAKLEKAVWAISRHQPDQCLDAEWRALIQTIKEYAIDSLQEVTADQSR